MTHVACRLTAKNRDQLRNPTVGNRVWATFFSPPVKFRPVNSPCPLSFPTHLSTLWHEKSCLCKALQLHSITALLPLRSSDPAEGREPSLPGLLVKHRRETVTHPSTNRTRRGVTSLTRPTSLPPRKIATMCTLYFFNCNRLPVEETFFFCKSFPP